MSNLTPKLSWKRRDWPLRGEEEICSPHAWIETFQGNCLYSNISDGEVDVSVQGYDNQEDVQEQLPALPPNLSYSHSKIYGEAVDFSGAPNFTCVSSSLLRWAPSN